MWKYLVIFGVILGITVYVSIENQHQAELAAQQPHAPVSPSADEKAAKDTKKPERNSPGWFSFFTWPDSITAWAIFLTLFAVAEQTKQTQKAAEAALVSANAARDQIGEMRAQAILLERQIALMKEQSDLMVEKERAKLRIELLPFYPVKDKEDDTYSVSGSVSNYGGTEAFVKRTEVYSSVGPTGIFNPLPEWLWGMHLPPVIRSGATPIPFRVMVMAADGPASDKEILPVREANEFIYIMAKIEFENAFGHRWIVLLRRRFGFIWPQVQSPDIGGNWEDNGPKADNDEYRVGAGHPPTRWFQYGADEGNEST